MTTYFRADFASGLVATRCSENRTYVACIAAHYGAHSRMTWVGRADLVASADRKFRRDHPRASSFETSEAVVEISAAEYRAAR